MNAAEFSYLLVHGFDRSQSCIFETIQKRYDDLLCRAVYKLHVGPNKMLDDEASKSLHSYYFKQALEGKWVLRNPFIETFVTSLDSNRSKLLELIVQRELIIQARPTERDNAARMWVVSPDFCPDGLMIETDGRLPLPLSSSLHGDYKGVPSDKVYHTLESIKSCLERIETLPKAAKLFWNGTRMLSIRRDVKSCRQYSGSFRSLPGLSVIYTTVDDRICDEDCLADSLVHEAVHGIIYAYEATDEHLLLPDKGEVLKVTSPWSGRQLDPELATQACFVWAILYQFWSVVEPKSHDMKRRALRGFAQPGYGRLISDLQHRLQPGVSEVLLSIPQLLAVAPIGSM